MESDRDAPEIKPAPLPRSMAMLSLALILLSGCPNELILPLPVISPVDPPPAAQGPVIDVWYGARQPFGRVGLPQRWVNILGNVSDEEHGLQEVRYSWPGGANVRLIPGPNRRRLVDPGDFNIELDAIGLAEGGHRLEITAVNGAGRQATATVIVEMYRRAWPLPYEIDWSEVGHAVEAVQIVDGLWRWDREGIRPVQVGYDRVLAVGDMGWTDYEVSVPVTVHGIDAGAYETEESVGPSFGLVLRWLGHTDRPVRSQWPAEPHAGWEPNGASAKYKFDRDGNDRLFIRAQPAVGRTETTDLKIGFGKTYVFKARAETTAGGNRYSLKVWEPDTQAEPAGWTLTRTAAVREDGSGNLRQGSLLLVLHHVDATFGDLQVKPVAGPD